MWTYDYSGSKTRIRQLDKIGKPFKEYIVVDRYNYEVKSCASDFRTPYMLKMADEQLYCICDACCPNGYTGCAWKTLGSD